MERPHVVAGFQRRFSRLGGRTGALVTDGHEGIDLVVPLVDAFQEVIDHLER